MKSGKPNVMLIVGTPREQRRFLQTLARHPVLIAAYNEGASRRKPPQMTRSKPKEKQR